MTGPDSIRRLLPVLDAAFQAEQMKMAKIVRRIADLQVQLTQLDRPRVSDFMNPAAMAGADLRWERWVQDRRKLLSQEIALAARDREAAKDGLRAALSKREAAKQIERKLSANAKQLTARRASS